MITKNWDGIKIRKRKGWLQEGSRRDEQLGGGGPLTSGREREGGESARPGAASSSITGSKASEKANSKENRPLIAKEIRGKRGKTKVD